jgi:hypothetical protein
MRRRLRLRVFVGVVFESASKATKHKIDKPKADKHNDDDTATAPSKARFNTARRD